MFKYRIFLYCVYRLGKTTFYSYVRNIRHYNGRIRKFNLLFETKIGVTEDAKSNIYLRGETAQGIFVNFLNVQRSMRLKLPFGIGGKGTKPSISVKWGARGGIIDSSTLIGIGAGEAGKEALLPLERNTGWMDILADRLNTGNTINVTLNANGTENPEQYAQRFARELRRQVRMGAI